MQNMARKVFSIELSLGYATQKAERKSAANIQ